MKIEPQKSLTIDNLKAIAMLLVLVDHITLLLSNYSATAIAITWPIGITGVALFFYTSGYLASRTHTENFTARKYIADRFVRLYPLYLIAVVVALLTTIEVQSGPVLLYPFMLQIFTPLSSGFLWFVPAMFLTNILYALHMSRRRYFWALCIGLGIYWGYMILSSGVWGSIVGVAEISGDVALFFVGAKHEVPSFCIFGERIKKLSRNTYPIYLFHIPIISIATQLLRVF